MIFLGHGFKSHIYHNKLFQTFPMMSNSKDTLPGIPMKQLKDIEMAARISSRPAIPPFQGGRVLQGLVWVSYILLVNLCTWSNRLILH